MAEYNPLKKDFWTWNNLSNKEQRDAVNTYAKERKEEKAAGRKEPEVNGLPKWKTCPKCHSTNVKLIKRTTMMMYLWIAGITLTLIGLIIWPLLIVAPLFFLLSPLPLFLPRQKKCRDCTHTYY